MDTNVNNKSAPSDYHSILNDMLALCHVPRWVIVPHSRPQSVGEHSFRVACILMAMCTRLGFTPPAVAYIWALIHDGPECRTGDLPMPVNLPDAVEARITPWYADIKEVIPPVWIDLIKVADLIETTTYINRWGVGPHAAGAASALSRSLREKCEAVGTAHGLPGLRSVATDLVQAIDLDTGRLSPWANEEGAHRPTESEWADLGRPEQAKPKEYWDNESQDSYKPPFT